MNILNALKQLRDDIKTWVTVNLNALNAKIDEKTIPIDSKLDSTSTNPVQNQAIAKEIDSINERVGDTPVATQISNAIDKVPTFSGDYNDLTNAPDISEDGSGNMVITDEAGNIIFKADADGIHTTAVSLNGEAAASEKYVDEAIANIDIPEVDFTGYATEDYVDNKVADLVNSAPEALDTLGELAVALKNHEDAYDALLETVGGKATHADLENLKEELSESITAEAEDWKVVDGNGNIIFSVDNTGAHTTNLTLNGEEAATEAYVNEAISNIEFPGADLTGYATESYVSSAVADLVNSAPEALNTLNELAAALGDDPNFATTIATELGKKANTEDLGALAVKDNLTASEVGALPLSGGTMTGEIKIGQGDGKGIQLGTNGRINATVGSTTTATMFGVSNGIYYLGHSGFSTTIRGSKTRPTYNGNDMALYSDVDKKVDKVTGKGLSTNDFTNEYKEKLDGLENIEFEETDPTVPAWAKTENKPAYTADEVGALSKDTPLFSGDYNDLENAPDISEDDSGNLIIADKDGNIIFCSNGDGFETVNLAVQNITINGKTIQKMIQEYVNEAILGGTW